jgi:hypothetical protein
LHECASVHDACRWKKLDGGMAAASGVHASPAEWLKTKRVVELTPFRWARKEVGRCGDVLRLR